MNSAHVSFGATSRPMVYVTGGSETDFLHHLINEVLKEIAKEVEELDTELPEVKTIPEPVKRYIVKKVAFRELDVVRDIRCCCRSSC